MPPSVEEDGDPALGLTIGYRARAYAIKHCSALALSSSMLNLLISIGNICFMFSVTMIPPPSTLLTQQVGMV